MSRKEQLEKIGATPGKLALVSVLAVVLVFVVVRQLPKSPSSSVAKSVPTKNTASITPTVKPKPAGKKIESSENDTLPPWPQVSLAAALANDPFEAPHWAVEQKAADSTDATYANELSELQKQGASIVVITNNRKSATIGDKKYRVGDELEGYRITDITAQGILLDKLKAQ